MKRVQAPNGEVIEFPDGMPDAEIEAVMQREFGGSQQSQAPQVQASEPTVGRARAVLEGVADTGTFGFGDEIGAALDLPVSSIFNGGAGDAYQENLNARRESFQDAQRERPGYTMAGQLGGALATLPIPGSAAPRAAGIGSRVLRGMAAGTGAGAAYGFGSGEGGLGNRLIGKPGNRLSGAAAGAGLGAITGAAAPVAVRGIQAAGRGVRNAWEQIGAPLRGLVNREAEAARRIGTAQRADNAIPQPRLTPADEQGALQAGQPVLNIDRGGEATRALARSAANTSPQGRAALENAVSDRFASQGDRINDTVRRIVGSRTTEQMREQIQQQARVANRQAYRTAYQAGAGGIWSPELERLASSPAVVSAMRSAATRGKDRAVTEGFGGFNPGVTVDASGIVTFRTGRNGVPTYPNLQYWDYVKRELDDMAGAARRTGRNEEATTIGGLARQLNQELDAAVPSYAAARAGAARFFGANDSVEAGEKFLLSRMANNEARTALAQMSRPDRALFAESFADALVRRVAESGDRRSVLNSLFITSRASRERIELALGPRRAREIEALLRVEALMDRARTAVSGNSTTARQLAEMGIAGGAGAYGMYTGDLRTTGTIIAALLARRGLSRIDRGVAQRVGEMLASPDPAIVHRGVQLVAHHGRFMDALRAADIPLAVGGAQQATENVGPLVNPFPVRPQGSGQGIPMQ